jgi:hypothetical protein
MRWHRGEDGGNRNGRRRDSELEKLLRPVQDKFKRSMATGLVAKHPMLSGRSGSRRFRPHFEPPTSFRSSD